MRARGKIFHIDCFRCIACSRQLIPGKFFLYFTFFISYLSQPQKEALVNNVPLTGDEFAIREDELFCKADHEVLGVGGLVGVGVGIGLGAGLAGGPPGGPADLKQEPTPDQSPLPLSPAKGASQGGAQTPNGGNAGSNGGAAGGPNGPASVNNHQLSSLSSDLASQYYSDDSTHGSSVVYSSVKSELSK